MLPTFLYKKTNQLHIPVTTQALITWILYIALFISILFSFRAISSICIAALLINGIFHSFISKENIVPNKYLSWLIECCGLMLILTAVSLFWTSNRERGIDLLILKSAILFIPLVFYLNASITAAIRNSLWKWFCLLVCFACIYCFCRALLSYNEIGDSSVFFYHKLVAPIKQHAVYFSIYILFALLFILETASGHQWIINRTIHFLLIIFFSTFLYLLSSKLVIVLFVIILLSLLLPGQKKQKQLLIPFILVGILIVSLFSFLLPGNPVRNRFTEIVNGNIRMVNQNSFSTADYFNGLQFRLLQYKIVPKILSKNNQVFMGTGPGDGQAELDSAYRALGMYTGEIPGKPGGYLGYNTHNQWLQTLMQNGLPGLLLFGLIGAMLTFIALNSGKRLAISVCLVSIIYSFTESVFETQYGIILFLFFPLFAAIGCRKPTF